MYCSLSSRLAGLAAAFLSTASGSGGRSSMTWRMSCRTRSRKWLRATPAAVRAASSRLSVNRMVRDCAGVSPMLRTSWDRYSWVDWAMPVVCPRTGLRTSPRQKIRESPL